ncbi:guanylate-binding protein 5 isoform X2 [Caretta caretta]|uniref:guanylate-binding protein 5 isoform X2 n=1 Tax=Caretta caretta TaxID=8467 RepID=UPI003F4BCCE5
MGTIENEAAVREALAHYVAGMRGLRVPAELGELLAMHGTCEEDALRLFVQRSFKDEGYTYQKRLMQLMVPRPSG